VRQVLERLGAPDRLARDITAAHRRPNDLLTGAGVAVRVTAASGFKAFVVAWAGLFLGAIALGLAVAGIRRVTGSEFLQYDWAVLDGLMPAVVGAVVAHAVGRSLVPPVAVAAHRSQPEVRRPVFVIGSGVALIVGLTAIEARWNPLTALAMASLPAWFALGVLRPTLVPRWQLTHRWFIGVVVLMVSLAIAMLAFGGVSVTTGESLESEPFDPNVAYASVGRFVDLEHPPLELSTSSESAGPWTGPGPIRLDRSGTLVAGDGPWAGMRLEVWPGPEGELNGPALDPDATAPLATAPMNVHGSRVYGSVLLEPQPRAAFYYVAVTALTPEGERVQLAWPGIEHWQWRGTALQYFEALLR
ncbi:MAG TPA: hypothetical protein VFP30_04085, partial [Candidatus Limnocylindria bacterium]|nr:hypothetical protein [Candidatus Limnocylindria bacterium]